MVLQRFTSRRGKPRSMSSDKGQNFVGANLDLKFLVKNLDQITNANNLSIRDIQWYFIPPSSPWMVGTWESSVKVTKKALKSRTNNWAIRENKLVISFVQIEGTINSCSLTSISDDTDNLSVLSPNHFISGQSSNAQGVVDTNKKDTASRCRWKYPRNNV